MEILGDLIYLNAGSSNNLTGDNFNINSIYFLNIEVYTSKNNKRMNNSVNVSAVFIVDFSSSYCLQSPALISQSLPGTNLSTNLSPG